MECELMFFDFIMRCTYEGYDVVVTWFSLPLYVITIIFIALLFWILGYKQAGKEQRKNNQKC